MIKKTKRYNKSRFVVYDIETLGLIPRNFLYGIVYNGEGDWKVFTNRFDMFADMIQRKNKGKIMLAHNCEFDLTGILQQNLIKFFGKDDIIYRGSNFISARYPAWINEKKKRRECIHFWDSMRFLLSSLSKIGEKIPGYEKLDTPAFLKNETGLHYDEGKRIFNEFWKDKETREYYIDYCLRDCELLYTAVDNFQNFLYDRFGCTIKPTISSIAFSIWKKNYLEKNWHDCNTKPNMAFKEAYYGGKVDVFNWGHADDIHYYDINSLYPYCGLKQYPHPYKLYYTTEDRLVDTHEGTGLFDVVAPDMHIPVLPFRKKGKLLFPTGKFEGWYNWNEVRYAKSLGYECKLKRGYFSNDTMQPLKRYYEDVYKLRSEYPKSHFYNLILKYLLNSLYGRFGLKIENKEYMFDHEFYNIALDPMNALYEEYQNWEHISLTDDGFGYARNINDPYYIHETTYYAIPSYVTSYARIELHKYLQEYQNDVLYCDTDSLFLRKRKLNSKYISDKLGMFKHEGSFKQGWFLGCKFYVLDECDSIWKEWNDLDVKIKGVRSKDITQCIFDLPDEFKSKSFFKNKEALRRSEAAGSLKEISKHINPRRFDKRTYNSKIDFRIENSKTFPIHLSI